MPRRFETRIAFLSEDDVAELPAEVILREGEMVIDIPKSAKTKRFLVVGKRMDDYWTGGNEAQSETGIRVTATWSFLRDRFVGTWVEDDIDYLFTFRGPT